MARKGYNPWLVGNDALGTVIEENKNSSETTPNISDLCSESSGSDREADTWEDECSENEDESLPIQRPSSERLSSCVTDALARCFRQDEMQQKASAASNPEISTGVEKLRTLRKDAAKKQCAAGKRPPRATAIQTEVNEPQGRTEHLSLWVLPVKQPLDPGQQGNSQARETGEEEEGLWDATSQRDREGDTKRQKRCTIENSASGKNQILPVPMRERGVSEDVETNANLQGSVDEERATVPVLVQVGD